MKRCLVIVMLIGFVFCARAQAQSRGFGMGVIVGEPTGVSFKQWTGLNTSLVGAVAWAFGRHKAVHLHLDYTFHNFRLIKAERHFIPFYYGIGLRFKDEGNDRLGVRFPFGIIYMLDDAPLDIFFEVVPIFDFIPRTELSFNAGIGIRYFF